MKVVAIQAGRPYEVLIEQKLLERAGETLKERLGSVLRVFVVTTAPVRKACGALLETSLVTSSIVSDWIEMPDGEKHKNMSTVEHLISRLVKGGADRKSVVLAFGGGVVGDTAAFAASIYMRGIDVVQVPTTLLAQVDASIGGKTGVNLASGKNLVGTFHQPRLVLTDPTVLATLPEREYRSGLYEAMKCGIIRNREIFDFMEANREKLIARDPEALEWLIAECIKVKAEVVAADEREGGERRILNFGHTIGHALEAETAYNKFFHGEAVAWGMVAASMIAAAMQKTDAETARRIISAVLAYSPLPKVESRSKNVLRRLKHDKKTLNGLVHFVLPLEIGKVEVTSDVPESIVLQAVDELRYLSQA